MDQSAGAAPLPRCLLVLVTVTAGLATLVAALFPDLLVIGTEIRSGAPFDEVLVDVCAWAVTGCAVWLWLATAVVVRDAARGRTARQQRGVPGAARRAVLAACGVALVGGLGAPAHAEEARRGGDPPTTSRVEGLPLPDRATTATRVSQVFARAAAHQSRPGPHFGRPPVVVVRPGDTLWGLARAELPQEVDDSAVAGRVREIHHANRAVIGADPDLIQPHQRLLMPRPRTIREEHR
jgi:hypothetical protein